MWRTDLRHDTGVDAPVPRGPGTFAAAWNKCTDSDVFSLEPTTETAVSDTAPKAHHPIRPRHQALTIALHWITVLLVVTQFALATLHERVSDAEIRRGVLTAHRSLGVVIWFLVVARLAWRLLGMRLLPFPASMAKWHQLGARLSEWG